MAKTVQLKRSAVLSLFALCGWKAANTWDNDRLASRMKDVPDVAPEGEIQDEAIAKTLIDVKAGVEDGAEFQVVDDEGQAPASGGTQAEEGAAAPAAETAAADGEKPAKAKKPKKEKAPKAPKEPKPPKEKKPRKGVREDGLTRGYYAGRVVAKYGLEVGITPEMIAEVDKLYGKPNESVSRGALSWAHSALRGFQDAKAEATETSA